jgi:hypothetical protein
MAIVLTGWVPLLVTGCATPATPPVPDTPAGTLSMATTAFDHSHARFDEVLKQYVDNGLVDYNGLQASPQVFYAYIHTLGAVDPSAMQMWSPEQKMAYWINAYNAFTILAIVERYPITERSLVGIFFPRNSILQISGIWNRLTFTAGGRQVTLGHIEHDILRKAFDDPRIHFAIVCASTSCPALRAEAYRADVLDHQLHEQTVAFINDPSRGTRWDEQRKRLMVSKIFKWFKSDFKTAGVVSGSAGRTVNFGNPIVAFIHPYLDNADVVENMNRKPDVRLAYLAYDWRLNEQTRITGPPPKSQDTEN